MESISAFDIIKVGIGPSSSHTMGPWRAAEQFVRVLEQKNILIKTQQIKVELFGSLAKTGHGHGTDIAVLLGLDGEDYTKIDTNLVDAKVERIKTEHTIHLLGLRQIPFFYDDDLIFHFQESLPFHPNGLRFTAWLEKHVPYAPIDQYRHNDTGEDNADSHIRRQLFGREVVVAITEGALDFGPWEQIFYGEFDGERKKRVLVKIIGQ